MFFEPDLPRETVTLPLAERLQVAAEGAGVCLELVTATSNSAKVAIRAFESSRAPSRPEGYFLNIQPRGITLEYRDIAGLRTGVATLRQLLREFGRRIPCLVIRDYPDFPRRGVMLDVSRGRIPSLSTLLGLVEHLADFKLNEFQLYTEHTFAYRSYERVWKPWGALTGEDILQLDRRCRQLGIDLVPNQNSFGHLRSWLEFPPLKKLAEVSEPYESADRSFLRYPTTLAPNHPGTRPFLRSLYDELLPHFTSRRFNVGCDETWDLGRGQSKRACATRGKGRVYVDFLKKIHREVSRCGRQMMFWGDIILHHPDLLKELPQDAIALNWGYEANHPFSNETNLFQKAGLEFYVCPGTSTWMTLIGRHDNAFANLRQAAKAGRAHSAAGYLITDWGDGGHPQPLAVSYAPYLTGAALSWCPDSFIEEALQPVLSRDVFEDPSGRAAQAALRLGVAHRQFEFFAPNVTPFGAVIAAPPPPRRELFCRDGLKYYARIPEANIRKALKAVQNERVTLNGSQPQTPQARVLCQELDLAARMAEQSCRFMLWQQQLAAGKNKPASKGAQRAISDLRSLQKDFGLVWITRNQSPLEKCAAFLQWRIDDYQQARLHYPPDSAR